MAEKRQKKQAAKAFEKETSSKDKEVTFNSDTLFIIGQRVHIEIHRIYNSVLYYDTRNKPP